MKVYKVGWEVSKRVTYRLFGDRRCSYWTESITEPHMCLSELNPSYADVVEYGHCKIDYCPFVIPNTERIDAI